jgi:hypothetical protein
LVGTAVLEYPATHGPPPEHVTRVGMPDGLIAHATRREQFGEVGPRAQRGSRGA